MSSRMIISAMFLAGLFLPAAALAGPAETVGSLVEKAEATPLTASETDRLVQGLHELAASQAATSEVLRLTKEAHGLVPDDRKAQISTKLLQRLTGTPESAARLTVDDMCSAAYVFYCLKGAPDKTAMVTSWMSAGQTWKTGGPKAMLEMIWALNVGDPADLARHKTALVRHIWDTYLHPQADLSKANGPEYADLAIHTHKLLPDAQKKQLADAMLARLTKPQVAAQLTMYSVRVTSQTLGTLGRYIDTSDVVAAWMANSDAWKQVSLLDLAFLADRLRAELGLRQDGIDQIMAHARSKKLFSDAEAVDPDSPWEWLSMVRGLHWFMSPTEKAAASELLRSAVLSKEGGWNGATADELNLLVGATGELGLPPQASEMLVGWLGANDLSAVTAADMTKLLECFPSAGADAGGDQRKALADSIWQNYLGNEAFLTSSDLSALAVLARSAAPLLSGQRQATLASSLTSRFASNDGALVTLCPGDAWQLLSAIRALGKQRDAAGIGLRWFAASEAWKQADAHALALLAQIVQKVETKEQQEAAAQWAATAYAKNMAAAGTNPPPAQLARIAAFMESTGLTGKGKGYTDFAAALASALKAGKPAGYSEQCQQLAFPLGTPAARAILSAELTDSAGLVRRDVARVMAWVYREYETLAAWREYIDRKLADPSITGDRKASWFLARADIEATTTGIVSLLAGKRWIERALAASTSESMKLRCVEVLALGYAELPNQQAARSLLASVEGQFQSAEAVQKLADIGNRVDEVSHEVRTHIKAAQESHGNRVRNVHTAELRRRLAKARQKGDREGIQRYERLLGRYE